MNPPILDTDRLRLRPIHEGDLDFIFKLFKREETNQYSEYPSLKTRDEAEEMFKKFMKAGLENKFRLLIEHRESGESLGTIGFYEYREDSRRTMIGYDLLKEYWRNGYTTEAVKVLIQYGFNDLNLMRIEATVDPENKGSIRVLEKTGFILEGTLKKRSFYRGRFHDELVYGLLKE